MFHTITRYGILNIVSLFSLSVNNKERMNTMIEVTRLNGTQILVNADLIELVDTGYRDHFHDRTQNNCKRK